MKLNVNDFIYVDKVPLIETDNLKQDFPTVIFIKGAAYFTPSIITFLNVHKPKEYIYYPKPLKYVKETDKEMKMYRYPELQNFEDFVSLVTGIIANENMDVELKDGDKSNENN